MEDTQEQKRRPGRPKMNEPGFVQSVPPTEYGGPDTIFFYRKVRFVQMHDALTPVSPGQAPLAPMMSLGTIGDKKMKSLEEHERGIYVKHPSGREFLVPYGNIAFYEYDLSQ